MVYGYRHAGEPLEVTALRLTVTIPVMKPNLDSLQGSITKTNAGSRRKIWFNDEWFDTSVYWRDELTASQSVSGPAIIEEYDSTIVVPPNWECSKAKHNCLLLGRKP